MLILHTDEIENAEALPQLERLAFYNGFDTMLVLEIHEKLSSIMDDVASSTYQFMLSLQAPCLDLMLTGTPVDANERQRKIILLEKKKKRLQEILDAYVIPLWGKPLNPLSWVQKTEFFYKFLRLPPVKKFDRTKGESTSTTDAEALRKLGERHLVALPIVNVLIAFSETQKDLSTLKAPFDPDGVFRASYNIAGTDTGRFSSKKNVFGRCSNDQNWTEDLRSIFIAPPNGETNAELS